MQSIIVLFVSLGMVLADGQEGGECFKELFKVRNCIVNNTLKDFHGLTKEATLAIFKEINNTCFNENCPRPDFSHPPTPGPRPAVPRATPSPQLKDLFNEAAQCVKYAFGQLDQCLHPDAQPGDSDKHFQQLVAGRFGGPQGGPGGPGGPHGAPAGPHGAVGPHGAGPAGFHPHPQNAFAAALFVCKGNQEAAKGFIKCGLDAVKKQGLDVIQTICKARQTCGSLSDTCKAELEAKRQKFCSCRDSTKTAASQNEHCQHAQELAQSVFAEANGQFNQNHPQQFDICAANDKPEHQDPCAASQ